MLRASSGKHARFVGVLAAGGDSVPRIPRIRGFGFFWRVSILENAFEPPPR